LSEVEQKGVVFIILALLRAVVLKDSAEFHGFLRFDVAFGYANGVYALLSKLVDIALKVGACVFTEHALEDSQIAFVVDFCSCLEGLERLYDLDSEPVALILEFANNHFVISLETSLLEDSHHAVVPDFELVAVGVSKLQLRLLLSVETFVGLRTLLLLALLGLLRRSVVAEG
jgi:hypothetical protein